MLENVSDKYQRNILRKILSIRWPERIGNDALCKRTKYHPGAN